MLGSRMGVTEGGQMASGIVRVLHTSPHCLSQAKPSTWNFLQPDIVAGRPTCCLVVTAVTP